MKRYRLYILIGALAAIVAVTTILLWRKDKISVDMPLPELKAQFLEMDEAWADSLVSTYTTDQKINALILHTVSSVSDSNRIFGQIRRGGSGVFILNPEPDFLAWIDTAIIQDSTVRIFKAMQFSLLTQNGAETGENGSLFCLNDENIDEYSVEIRKIRRNYGINFLQINLSEAGFVDSVPHLTDVKSCLDRCPETAIDSVLADSVLLFISAGKVPPDSALQDSLVPILKPILNKGIPAIGFSGDGNRLVKKTEFSGLIVTHIDTLNPFDAGVISDLYITESPEALFKQLFSAVRDGYLPENELDRRVKRVIMARKWTRPCSSKHTTGSQRYFRVLIRKLKADLQKAGISLIRNKDRILPLANIPDRLYVVRIGEPVVGLIEGLSHYTNPYSATIKTPSESAKINWKALTNYNPVIIAVNQTELTDSAFLASLFALDKQTNVILINAGYPQNLDLLGTLETVVQMTGSGEQWNWVGQMVCGGQDINGKLVSGTRNFRVGHGLKINRTRLGYAGPYEVAMDPSSLSGISWIAAEGINNRAFPGCQVIAVRNGQIVYNQSFGHLSYDRRTRVSNDHLYDLASVTKVAATTLAGMMLYDQGKYRLSDSLYRYLPDTLSRHIFRGRSTLRYLTWQEVFTHNSGLPPGFPYVKYVQYKDSLIGRFDKYYCDMADDSCYFVPVAEGFYMDGIYQDSIWYKMNELILDPAKSYVYSDVNFILLYKLFKGMLEADPELVKKPAGRSWRDFNAFEAYLNEQVYRPLDMGRTTFLPLRYFTKDVIAPTEDDRFWRKQVVHGYVHDPTAALLGGISGNAGLFANAHDMAVLFQMYLNKGYYGGRRYIKAETIERFIQRQPGSFRGLGFNKPVGGGMYGIPEKVSVNTFGHTGFTGNSIWADPDNDIIYIFLSNRSHPDAHNPGIIQLGTRKRIHQAIYDARLSEDWLHQVDKTDTTQVVS